MNQKSNALVAILIVALIIIGGISYWGMQQKQELLTKLSDAEQQILDLEQENASNQDAAQETAPSDQEVLNAAYEDEDIGQWQHYTSTAMNISFQYPPTFVVLEKKNELVVADPSQPVDTDGYRMITISKESDSARNLSAKYIGFNTSVQWNPFSESTRKFASTVAMIPHFSGDMSRYVTYLFPNGFVDVNRISPAESAQWTQEKIQNQIGTLIVANTVSDATSDDVLKKAQDVTTMDLYQDLPTRILSTLRFVKK
jgi:hypothetical protein